MVQVFYVLQLSLSNKIYLYLFSAVLSSMFLNEMLNGLGKVGVILSLMGSTMIVIHAPRHERVSDFTELIARCSDPGER